MEEVRVVTHYIKCQIIISKVRGECQIWTIRFVHNWTNVRSPTLVSIEVVFFEDTESDELDLSSLVRTK